MTDLFAEIEPEPARRIGRDAPWLRRAVLAAFAALIAAVLAGAIGQVSGSSSAQSAAARIELTAPHTVRGGLLFQARVRIHATQAIARPTLVLQRGWLEGMQVSSIEPQPAQETGEGDTVSLSYDKLDAGAALTVWLQFQVDPTTVGHRPADVALLDGTTPLVRIDHTLTILP